MKEYKIGLWAKIEIFSLILLMAIGMIISNDSAVSTGLVCLFIVSARESILESIHKMKDSK